MPSSRQRTNGAVEALELQLCELGIPGDLPVGHGQMRPERSEAKRTGLSDGVGQPDDFVERRAHPMHPSVDLEMHVDRGPAPGRRGLGQFVDAWPGVDGGTSCRPMASAMPSTGGSESRRIGTSMPASRRAIPSSTRATANQLAPPSTAARATDTAPWP